MDPQQLVKLGTDPKAWIDKSLVLRRSADALWQNYLEARSAWDVKRDQKRGDAADAAAIMDGHLACAKLLYGLALETTFKACILHERPDGVRIETVIDGAGKVHSAQLKEIGVDLADGHNLVQLAERAGVFKRGIGEMFTLPQEYVGLRAILEELGEVIVWSGRYPVPKASGKQRKYSGSIPPEVFGGGTRLWTDAVLDACQTKVLLSRP